MVDVLFSFLCVLISIRCLGCSFKEIFRTLKDFLLYNVTHSVLTGIERTAVFARRGSSS